MTPKTTPKDFFLHLAAVVALYASAIALINLAFSVVNYYNPDALAGYFSVSSIAWPISMLVVLIPVLYVIEWLIGRDLLKMPEKKDLWIRRWRIYLTLFLGAAAIITDLVVLINWFLNGEITSRFVYKVLVVIVVAGIIFTYYLLARLFESIKARNWRKILAWIGIVLILATIIGGFTIVGSPAKQRALRFDETKINDLSNIESSVAHYWQEFGKVPSDLSIMPEYMSGVPKDPVTQIPYHYEAGLQSNSFKICATFSASSTESNLNYPRIVPSYANGFYDWNHGAGEACFSRVISPVDFPPVKAIPVSK